jgi:hypothetical protein
MPSEFLDFLATSEGVALAMAFARIPNSKIRRAIVALIEEIVSGRGS